MSLISEYPKRFNLRRSIHLAPNRPRLSWTEYDEGMMKAVSNPIRSHTILDSEIGNRSVTSSSIVEIKKDCGILNYFRKILLPLNLKSTDKYRTKLVKNNNNSQMHSTTARYYEDFIKIANLDPNISSVPMLILIATVSPRHDRFSFFHRILFYTDTCLVFFSKF